MLYLLLVGELTMDERYPVDFPDILLLQGPLCTRPRVTPGLRSKPSHKPSRCRPHGRGKQIIRLQYCEGQFAQWRTKDLDDLAEAQT